MREEKREPLVSVIVPVYNVEKYLRRCLDSIIEQTYKNIEIILVDDGSTDKSGEICDEYKKKDERITVIHQLNNGVSETRNVGIRNSSGEYIMFIDSDDFVLRKYVRALVDAVISSEAEVAQCEVAIIRENETAKRLERDITKSQIRIIDGLEAVKMMLYQDTITSSLWGKIIKKSLFNHVNFPKVNMHEDLYVLYFLLKKAKRVVIINKVLYVYMLRKNSLIHSDFSKSTLDVLDIMEEIEADIKANSLPLEGAVNSRKVNACFFILRQLPGKNEKLEKRLMEEVKRLRRIVLADSMVRKKTKVGLVLSYFGMPVVKVVYGLLNRTYSMRSVQ
ncbi:glycosyltransferase [Candidatus Saccharibacteria bacterium]|nr:glycosyltransferase [Candidatus Saccharibacteria bacterium]